MWSTGSNLQPPLPPHPSQQQTFWSNSAAAPTSSFHVPVGSNQGFHFPPQQHGKRAFAEEEADAAYWTTTYPQPPSQHHHNDVHGDPAGAGNMWKRMRYVQEGSVDMSFNMANPSPTSVQQQPCYPEDDNDDMEVESVQQSYQQHHASSTQPTQIATSMLVGRNTNGAKYGHMLNQAWFLNHMSKSTSSQHQANYPATPQLCWKCYANTTTPNRTIMCYNCSRYCCSTSACINQCDQCTQLHCTACIMVDYRHHIQERKLCIDCYYSH